jgi:site-specific recombinase XerD
MYCDAQVSNRLGALVGARIHDLRHSMVSHRMQDWYKSGINPQSKLPYLATYLGHKDIRSTLVYLNITPELLQEAGERFRKKRRGSDTGDGGCSMKSNSLSSLLHAFFHEWMGKQRNLSRHTVCSYRDTWKLFLRFASERKRREIAQLSLADLQAGEVLAFLEHLEKDRKVSIGTRNCRLACARTSSIKSASSVLRTS